MKTPTTPKAKSVNKLLTNATDWLRRRLMDFHVDGTHSGLFLGHNKYTFIDVDTGTITITTVLDNYTTYPVEAWVQYSNSLTDFLKQEMVDVSLVDGYPTINLDIETYWDNTDITYKMVTQYKIETWADFDAILAQKAIEDNALKEQAAAKRKKKSQEKRQAKIQKEIDERAMLAELLKKYGNPDE